MGKAQQTESIRLIFLPPKDRANRNERALSCKNYVFEHIIQQHFSGIWKFCIHYTPLRCSYELYSYKHQRRCKIGRYEYLVPEDHGNVLGWKLAQILVHQHHWIDHKHGSQSRDSHQTYSISSFLLVHYSILEHPIVYDNMSTLKSRGGKIGIISLCPCLLKLKKQLQRMKLNAIAKGAFENWKI